MNKKQQEEQRRQEDLALKRGLLWAAGAVVLEMLLFLISRYAYNFDATEQGVAIAETLRAALKVLSWVGVIAFAGGAILLGAQTKKNGKTLWAAVAAVAGIMVFLCAHVALKYQTTGLRMLYLLVPVAGGLALSYYIYQMEFFLSALPAAVAALGLWFIRVGGITPELALTVLAVVGALVVALRLKKGDGAVKVGDKTLQLLPEKSSCNVPVGSAVVALAVQLLAAVAGGGVAYYLIFAMGAWLFALLVYYTVKML